MSDIQAVAAADAAALAGFDAIIDVRSPSEFAEDHVPGAISLPVLDERPERPMVGTILSRTLRFRARRIGAAIVARNVARHLETALADKPGDFKPLVYCWRGGQRSGAMATILSQVGWRTAVLAGGYKTYRRTVKARLYDEEPALKLVLLEGRTGSGKTEILARLATRGVQIFDSEASSPGTAARCSAATSAARNPARRCSSPAAEPALGELDLSRPIVVEAEASKVGDRMVPPAVWKAMAAALRDQLLPRAAGRPRPLPRHALRRGRPGPTRVRRRPGAPAGLSRPQGPGGVARPR